MPAHQLDMSHIHVKLLTSVTHAPCLRSSLVNVNIHNISVINTQLFAVLKLENHGEKVYTNYISAITEMSVD